MDYIHAHPEELFTGAASSLPDGHRSDEETFKIIATMNDPLDFGEIMGFKTLMNQAKANGDWHEYSGVGFFLTPRENGVVEAHFQHSTQIGGLYTHDAWDLTTAEIECRKQLQIAYRFFKKYMPGFENAYIVKICPELRLREGRRIMGDYVLTSDDIENGARFDDVVALSCMMAGGHHAATNTTFAPGGKMTKGGGSWDIPYRVLVPKKVENLLVAGKHVSTDRDAYMRFLQQTMVTGQAAGVAAGLSVKNGKTPREMEAPEYVAQIQKTLLEQGAVLKTEH
jgi:hypothetical protein